MSDYHTIGTTFAASTVAWPNPWARISEIAAKVGVLPFPAGSGATITAVGADGNPYDVWEVVAAVLDRLDRSDDLSAHSGRYW